MARVAVERDTEALVFTAGDPGEPGQCGHIPTRLSWSLENPLVIKMVFSDVTEWFIGVDFLLEARAVGKLGYELGDISVEVDGEDFYVVHLRGFLENNVFSQCEVNIEFAIMNSFLDEIDSLYDYQDAITRELDLLLALTSDTSDRDRDGV